MVHMCSVFVAECDNLFFSHRDEERRFRLARALSARRRAERKEYSDRLFLVQAVVNADLSKDASDTLNFALKRLASEVFQNFKFGATLRRRRRRQTARRPTCDA